MQLKISHKLAKPIVLPINYAHILQGIVYKALSEGQLSNSNMTELIHDIGWKFEQRSYKFFQFSGIAGHYQISGKNIIFDDSMSWEIRTPDSMIINSIKSGMEKSGIEYLSSIANNLELTLSDDSIEDNRLLIRMRTPICVYSTDVEGGKRYYYAPDEQEFYQAVTENFIRKYYDYLTDTITFKDTYSPEVVKKWLALFIRRFFNNQFKRSCIPDGAKISEVSLSPRGDFRMPSDTSYETFLDIVNNL